MLLIAIIIFFYDHGNPFYFQERVGKNGRLFKIVKFRSMIKDADKVLDHLTKEQRKQYIREFKIDNDPRLLGYKVDKHFSLGQFLRMTSLDELPQIPYNVFFKMNMSLVGPRPILEKELKNNYTLEEQKLLVSTKPGITGYWQAYARNNASYKTGKRQEMELFYIKNRSLSLDFKILLHTIDAVLSKRGAK